ncbi:unnamed protein product, partial [Owenia fusiformis]
MATANSKLWDYIRGRDAPFILSGFAGQEATIPVCAVWGCIVNHVSLQSPYDAERYKYFTMTLAGVSDVAIVFDLIIQRFGWNKIGLVTFNHSVMSKGTNVLMKKLAERNITPYADVLFDRSSPEVIWKRLKGIRIIVSFVLH